jgi:hypothetical protein
VADRFATFAPEKLQAARHPLEKLKELDPLNVFSTNVRSSGPPGPEDPAGIAKPLTLNWRSAAETGNETIASNSSARIEPPRLYRKVSTKVAVRLVE